MTSGETLAAGRIPAEAPAADTPDRGRRPWWIWAAPFAMLFTSLLIANSFLFSGRLYERGDSGANSILIQQAMRFGLLVGNYSRERFNHPGPAYMYVQAFGQWLFYYGLHVVPAAWNSHMLAVFALNSAFIGLAVMIVYGWTRSLRGATACFAVILVFAAVHPLTVTSDWMPYLYVPTYCVFLLAAASFAAGHSRDAWILALTGWFLIHGQACFLFFVPAILVAVYVILVVRHRRAPWTATRRFAREQREAWIPALAISAVFALPIAVNLALHWPGDFARYIDYGNSGQAGGHSAAQVTHFVLWFWWPHANAWLAPALLYAVALAVAFGLARGPLRRFLVTVAGINLVSTAALCVYAAVGIDFLSETYIGYFYWSAPMVTLLAAAVGAAQAFGARSGTIAVAVAALASFAVLLAVPGLRTGVSRTDPTVPGAVARLAALARGRTIVLTLDQTAWGDATGFLVQAERTHVRACVDQPWWTFMMTKQFICTPQEAANGVRYWFNSTKPPPAAPVLFRFGGSDVTARPS